MRFVIASIALISGVALAVQVGMNNGLRAKVGHPVVAAWLSFAIGTTAISLFLIATQRGLPGRSTISTVPWWAWGGGLVGAIYVGASAAFASRLGAAAWLGLIVTGQIVASLVLDHFGLVGFPRRPISPTKLLGAVVLLAGVALVLRPSSPVEPANPVAPIDR